MKGDPFKMKAKFSSKCSNCNKEIKKGDWIVYYPRCHSAECLDCGKKSLDAIIDEDFFVNNSL